ncbi:glycine receptor subunit alpha-2-like isoform X2 [Lineus longissimus]|uniref:glycine receptor subunit alpha-2-like isoform X2 n=1 Tax=Lineus longissimus TaxID=88925 RepID=UPI00315DFC5C
MSPSNGMKVYLLSRYPCAQAVESPSVEKMLTFLDDEEYDKYIPPDRINERPTKVWTMVYINSISSVDEIAMDMEVDLFLQQWWTDQRLINLDMQVANPTFNVEVEGELKRRLWRPDLFFLNSKYAFYHTITKKNSAMHVITLTGDIYATERISVKLHCPMKLYLFPMDTQKCRIIMTSYAMRTDDVIFQWHRNGDGVAINEEMTLPKFEIVEEAVELKCVRKYRTGNFTCLTFSLTLARKYGYYIIQVYIPSMLVVIISWVSFFLSPDAVAARTSLGVVTVLTVTTQNANVNDSTPKVSYVKAIDVWHAACLLFVFAALLEFAVANSLRRKQLRRKQIQERLKMGTPGREGSHQAGGEIELDTVYRTSKNSYTPVDSNASSTSKRGLKKNANKNKKRSMCSCLGRVFCFPSRTKAKHVDYVSRIAFPSLFVLFNAVYWTIYQHPTFRKYLDAQH